MFQRARSVGPSFRPCCLLLMPDVWCLFASMRPTSDTTGAFVGRRWKDSIEVTILSRQQLRDTIDVFHGRVAGDTIFGRYRFRGDQARLLRQPPP